MDREFQKMFSDKVNERVRAMRPSLQQAMVTAQTQVPEGQVVVKDGYAGLRYLSKVLYNTRDMYHVETVHPQELFLLLVDGIVGAAVHRIEKRQKMRPKPWPVSSGP